MKRLRISISDEEFNTLSKIKDERMVSDENEAVKYLIRLATAGKISPQGADESIKKIRSSNEDNDEYPVWRSPSYGHKRITNETLDKEVRVEDLPFDITREEKMRRSMEGMAKYKPNLNMTAAQMVAELNGTEVDEEADFEEKKQALRKKFPHLSEAKIEEMAAVEFDADGNPIY